MDPNITPSHTGHSNNRPPKESRSAFTVGTVAAIVILVFLYIFASLAHGLILGNAKPVTLAQAQALSGVISQSLGANADGNLPVAGTDYHLTTKYFDNNTWAVAYIKPVGNNFEPSAAVLKKIEGTYQVVIEPSNSLPVSTVKALPADVANFLRTYVAVYQPLPSQQ